MVKTTEAKQVCHAASTLVYLELDFEIKPCGTYTREDSVQVEKFVQRVRHLTVVLSDNLLGCPFNARRPLVQAEWFEIFTELVGSRIDKRRRRRYFSTNSS